MSEATDFLYPFIDARERDPRALLDDLARSAREKSALSSALAAGVLDRLAPVLGTIAHTMAARFQAGGRLFAFGNGGSSTDAASLAALFACPPWGRALPARDLVDDTAILTALANDVGFELVFSRQLIAYSSSGDIAVGLSTSGNSRNLIVAFAEARSRGLLTVGLAGYDGGEMVQCGDVDQCLVVPADSVHRIQETQSALAFSLWLEVQERLAPMTADD